MMPRNEGRSKHPEWAAFVQYLLQSHSAHELARAAEVQELQVKRWLRGCRPAERQIEVMALHLKWSVFRQLRARDAAGYFTTPRPPRKD
jgi:hypothetical protein